LKRSSKTKRDRRSAVPLPHPKPIQHLSLFRYPGGKSWLVPHINRWLLNKNAGMFIEPFAGGGAISLAVANQQLARHVLMCEIDRGVAAVWNSVLNGDANWLRKKIASFSLTKINVRKELAAHGDHQRRLAFRTLLRNRTSHGGLLTPGSALLRKGENGKGLQSRWYPETLVSRLDLIKTFRDRITFVEGDGVQLLESLSRAKQCFFFLDPPYTAGSISAGARMYEHHEVDHARLFSVAKRMAGEFLMSYDDTPEIRLMARAHGFKVHTVEMRTRHHVAVKELLICRDFAWLKKRVK
jgi:DNA adenine methylase